eukprot:TRINITY_DN1003_c0_g1_i9.p1 TRINITY_DN1003_c0_g1~~TRINITY_DN1003_c0_g1_i9.p1  ORF type:complete len:277 (-),score=94.72 TRINITY_DN1003_c0_g1_i9:548-1378(-)
MKKCSKQFQELCIELKDKEQWDYKKTVQVLEAIFEKNKNATDDELKAIVDDAENFEFDTRSEKKRDPPAGDSPPRQIRKIDFSTEEAENIFIDSNNNNYIDEEIKGAEETIADIKMKLNKKKYLLNDLNCVANLKKSIVNFMQIPTKFSADCDIFAVLEKIDIHNLQNHEEELCQVRTSFSDFKAFSSDICTGFAALDRVLNSISSRKAEIRGLESELHVWKGSLHKLKQKKNDDAIEDMKLQEESEFEAQFQAQFQAKYHKEFAREVLRLRNENN